MSGPRRRARLDDIARIAQALREPVETPDFTGSILERVNSEKPFLPERTRRWVPIVRVGAAGVSVLAVLVMTLIICLRPELPEQLGAEPSVTTALVQSAEHGVARKMETLRSSVAAFQRAADPRRWTVIVTASTEPASGVADSAVGVDAPLVADATEPFLTRAGPMSEVTILPISLPGPVTTPMSVALPAVAFDVPDLRAFTSASIGAGSFSTGYPPGSPWNRGGYSAAVTLVGFSSSLPAQRRPAVNRMSPTLVRELVPLITGQPAGDEELIR